MYRRNADEFTAVGYDNLLKSQKPKTGFWTILRWSLPHLLAAATFLAMFARTPVAKAFRKWVLDVLDRLAAEERLPCRPTR